MRALETQMADLVLPYVPTASEDDVAAAFEKTMMVRASGAAAAEVANE